VPAGVYWVRMSVDRHPVGSRRLVIVR
jgi:hypothetical protein